MSILKTSIFIAFTLIIVLLIKVSTHIIYQINIETSYFKNIYLFDINFIFNIIICITLFIFYYKLEKKHCFLYIIINFVKNN